MYCGFFVEQVKHILGDLAFIVAQRHWHWATGAGHDCDSASSSRNCGV
jgi:hypothetical protein